MVEDEEVWRRYVVTGTLSAFGRVCCPWSILNHARLFTSHSSACQLASPHRNSIRFGRNSLLRPNCQFLWSRLSAKGSPRSVWIRLCLKCRNEGLCYFVVLILGHDVFQVLSCGQSEGTA